MTLMLPLVRLNQTFGGRQTQTGSPRLGREERQEDLLSHVGGNARAAVAERNLAGIAHDGDQRLQGCRGRASHARH